MISKISFFKGLVILGLIFSLNNFEAYSQTEATYTVKTGDTLYNISKRLNVTIAELKQWNNLSGNEIELGQALVYYRPEENVTSMDSLPEQPSDPLISRSTDTQTKFYIVKSGDTLYEIARDHDMTVSQLQALNNLSGSSISVGQRLTVKEQPKSTAPNVARFTEESSPQGMFSTYQVQPGETKQEILSRFKLSENELEQMNPAFNLDDLSAGDELTVLLPPSRNYDNPFLKKANLQNLGQVSVSKYNDGEAGSTTTNGELYDPELLTAAHSNIALGTIVFVENPITKNGVYVKINDRITGSGIKLSQKAYDVLSLSETGDPAISIYTEINE